jgi:hypothetical protein
MEKLDDMHNNRVAKGLVNFPTNGHGQASTSIT